MDTEYLEERNLSSIKVGIVLINYLIAVLFILCHYSYFGMGNVSLD